MRIGFGFDVHELTADRDLWLGGIRIPSDKGALGHSDADVLLHAICDALLGALALGDIGQHFPDTDNAFRNIDSKKLLARVVELVKSKGYRISNIDSSLCIEKPKVMPYALQMRECIAGVCEIGVDDISIKATTNEKMGFIGRREGLTAYAVALLVRV
jgi:2-C-methyl-D-erythritol 2,4-cyclodiphosphate synthase